VAEDGGEKWEVRRRIRRVGAGDDRVDAFVGGLAGRVDLSKLEEARTLEALLPEVRRRRSDAVVINPAVEICWRSTGGAVRRILELLGAANEAAGDAAGGALWLGG